MALLINKARRPKFEVHLKIYDLNNVPLVHGASHIKWHILHSVNSDHRGRTPKCPIANHRVEYGYSKLIPVRMAIDKNNALSECLIEFEIVQEFPSTTTLATSNAAASVITNGSKDERITLGKLVLNLAEYVEESEAIMRDNHGFRATTARTRSASAGSALTAPQQQQQASHSRNPSDASSKRASFDSGSKRPTTPPQQVQSSQQQHASNPLVEEGIIRRYLLTDSKINSTLKISLLVHQLEGERAFIAPTLKTAGAVFGGGILGGASRGAGEDFGQHFQDTHPEQDVASLSAAFKPGGVDDGAGGANNRDAAAARHELQDVYRRALSASWACQLGGLPADECIEDIFGGGDGFGLPDDELDTAGADAGRRGGGDATPRGPGGIGGTPPQKTSAAARAAMRREDSGSSTGDGAGANELLRPSGGGGGGGGASLAAALRRNGTGGGSQRRRQGHGHVRNGSGESVGALRRHRRSGSSGGASVRPAAHKREGSKDSATLRGAFSSLGRGGCPRRDSLLSLTESSTIESERSRSGFKSAREVTEREVREDFVAWALPGTAQA